MENTDDQRAMEKKGMLHGEGIVVVTVRKYLSVGTNKNNPIINAFSEQGCRLIKPSLQMKKLRLRKAKYWWR